MPHCKATYDNTKNIMTNVRETLYGQPQLTEEQKQDLDERAEAVLKNLKGLTRANINTLLARVDYHLEQEAVLN